MSMYPFGKCCSMYRTANSVIMLSVGAVSVPFSEEVEGKAAISREAFISSWSIAEKKRKPTASKRACAFVYCWEPRPIRRSAEPAI